MQSHLELNRCCKNTLKELVEYMSDIISSLLKLYPEEIDTNPMSKDTHARIRHYLEVIDAIERRVKINSFSEKKKDV